MLLKRNLLESLSMISCGGSLICILLQYVTNISPISGVWFPIYILVVFFASLIFSFKFIQWLLHLNKPIIYDLHGLQVKYPFLSSLARILPPVKVTMFGECKEYDTNELSVISTVLERKLISSWYLPYISQEIGFPFACKQMLDQMIGKSFQICNKIETKDIFIDICSILTSHLKEYKKAIKRHEICPGSSIESLYKTSHTISNNPEKNYQSADHCTNILRIVLKELVPWELWDTPHSELLVRILSKKLDNFIDSTLADPAWLNDRLMTILKGESKVNNRARVEVGEPKPDNVEIHNETNNFSNEDIKENTIEIEVLKPEPTIESALSTLITKSTAPILHMALDEEYPLVPIEEPVDDSTEVATTVTEPLDIQSSPVLRQRRGRQGMKEVKIYDRVIEGSVKTWETDVDLQCISLGQDLLASLNGEVTLSRLWGQDGDADPAHDQGLWFGEEDTLDLELSDTSPKTRSPVKKEHSPKPTDALLKDLQTTVHQAKTKIGDLQVTHIDVHPNNDEAAGMMEGLLDFGIAGFKKGLRFTGLSDDSQDKSPSHHGERNGDKHSPPLETRTKPVPIEGHEVIVSSLIQREDNGFGTGPHLVKQQRIASQDSVPSLPKPLVQSSPPLALLPDSPEPQYEEAADLSTSIAKLRVLLQQRAGNSVHRAEDIWWEGAEETRGRTQHQHSSRPVDSAALADEYDMTAERGGSPGLGANNMQRLDKLFHRTVTGVFNSIKTAVGAEGEAPAHAAGPPAGLGPPLPEEWAYVCTSVELSVCGAVARLVGSRRAYSHVDAALDSLQQLSAPPVKAEVVVEDFDDWCATQGACWSGALSLASAAGLCRAHVGSRAATLLLADLVESLISSWLSELSSWLRLQVFASFEQMCAEPAAAAGRPRGPPRGAAADEICAAVMANIPAVVAVLGEEAVSGAVRLCADSLSHKPVNKDVAFRLLDLIALQFKSAAAAGNPSFDSN